jgi:DNA-binding transcriptional ArsR family regulator
MKSTVVLAALVGFALINTGFLGIYLFSTSDAGGLSAGSAVQAAVTSTVTETATSAENSLSTNASVPTAAVGSNTTNGDTFSAATASTLATSHPSSALQTLAQFFENHSLVLAPTSWFFVGGMWIWRGRMKSKWTDLGFDSDVFGLFVRMKGAKTRIRLLDALSVPKDRLQLAQELGLDWKAVDRHVTILRKYGFVEDRVAYGKVRMYELTPIGRSLLHLLEDLSKEETREWVPISPALQE